MIVWQQEDNHRHYRVTRAGASTRLYTDGVFHSQYNPRQPVGGNIWDLLFLPALMHPHPQDLQRVLVLGVGGGAVIQQLNHFLQPAHITGVDLDPIHLHVAQKYFGVNSGNVTLIQAEARGWLRSYRGPKFDLIIEDLFMDGGRDEGRPEPVRAIEASVGWLSLLSRRLTSGGVLVMNFESRRSLGKSGYREIAQKPGGFSAGYSFTCPRYENAIAAFVRQPVAQRQFSAALQRFPALDRRRKSCRLDFVYRKLIV